MKAQKKQKQKGYTVTITYSNLSEQAAHKILHEFVDNDGVLGSGKFSVKRPPLADRIHEAFERAKASGSRESKNVFADRMANQLGFKKPRAARRALQEGRRRK